MRSKAVWLDRTITENYSDFEYLIYTICFHGAPALAGMKTGTMLCFNDRIRIMTTDRLKEGISPLDMVSELSAA